MNCTIQLRVVRLAALVLAAIAPACATTFLSTLPGLTVYRPGSNTTFDPTYFVQAVAFNQGATSLLVAAGNSSSTSQTIYSMPITRYASGHIASLGPASSYASVPVGAQGVTVGGGMVLTPSGTLVYTTSDRGGRGQIGQYFGGSSSLTTLGFGGLGGLGYSASGKLKLSTSDGTGGFYNLNLGGTGPLYTVGTTLQSVISLGASFAYAPADADFFSNAGLIAGEPASAVLNFYEVDADGNPVGTAPTTLVSVLDGNASIGYGLARDPITGDFVFSSGDQELHVLSDSFSLPNLSSVPEPGTWFLFAGGLAAVAALRRRRVQ